jgi:hypothetical protein
VHQAGKLQFFGEHAALADARAFKAWIALLRQCEWVVCAERPFAGPQAVLAYLSRYTHRVAISNCRLIAVDERGVTFRRKDYRITDGAKGEPRRKMMTLGADEFMQRYFAARAAGWRPPDLALQTIGQRQPQGQPGTGALGKV